MNNPGFIDLQLNGYAGVDFNDDALTPEGLHAACVALERDGVAGVLATVVTERLATMVARLRRLVELRARDDRARRVILGLHVEGPFLNEGADYRGAHPPDAICPADTDAMERLLEAGDGLVRLVTLAPECDAGLRVTRMLARRGVVVSAGHCGPSVDVLDAAIDAGLSMWTHLGNGCPKLLPRHHNLIEHALARSDRLWLCFIADGIHVPYFALRNHLRAAGFDRAIIVTDGIAAAGLGPGTHRVSRWQVHVGDDLAAWAPGRSRLVGSAMTLQQARARLLERGLVSAVDVDRMMRDHPLAALGRMAGPVEPGA